MRYLTALCAACFLCVALALPVLADSPHFITATASLLPSGSLSATFKEAGLGDTVPSEHITLSAAASALYACINGGGKHPQAANKATVSGPLTSSGNFSVRNGQATGSLSVGPLGPGGFACPNGQMLVLVSVRYTGVTLTGLAGDTAAIPGTFAACLAPQYGLCA